MSQHYDSIDDFDSDGDYEVINDRFYENLKGELHKLIESDEDVDDNLTEILNQIKLEKQVKGKRIKRWFKDLFTKLKHKRENSIDPITSNSNQVLEGTEKLKTVFKNSFPKILMTNTVIPIRSDDNVCISYSKTGVCIRGTACKFIHKYQEVSSTRQITIALDHIIGEINKINIKMDKMNRDVQRNSAQLRLLENRLIPYTQALSNVGIPMANVRISKSGQWEPRKTKPDLKKRMDLINTSSSLTNIED